MPKRFTATEKWEDPWFRRLSPKIKMLWLYLCDCCDNAGVWKIDFELASFRIGEQVNKPDIDFINNDKERVVFVNDNYLVVKDFIFFQIGHLKKGHLTNLQKNCISLINNYLNKGVDVQKMCNLTGSLPVVIGYKYKGIGKGKDIKIKKRIVKEKQTDQEFIEVLKVNPAYTGIDIDCELGKMDAWFLTPKGHGRKKTRQFILNWLNRADKPVSLPKPAPQAPVKFKRPDPAEQARVAELIRNTKDKIGAAR